MEYGGGNILGRYRKYMVDVLRYIYNMMFFFVEEEMIYCG